MSRKRIVPFSPLRLLVLGRGYQSLVRFRPDQCEGQAVGFANLRLAVARSTDPLRIEG